MVVSCFENYVSPTQTIISHFCTDSTDFSIVSEDVLPIISHLQDEYYVVNNRPNKQ
jgi:hypothetical protein